jgi:quercetin dioxygenase-like cupin family protein
MAGESMQFQARRVITGWDENGKSKIDIDEDTPRRTATPGYTVCQVWRAEQLPVHPEDDDAVAGEADLSPADRLAAVPPPPSDTGLVVEVDVFPPDKEVNFDEVWGPTGESGIPGLHGDDSQVDVVTVVSGEIYCVLETGETLLKPGDTIVQRGTNHAWSNRGDVPAVVVALKLPAKR